MDTLTRDHDPDIPKPSGQELLLHSDFWEYWKRLNEFVTANTITVRTDRFKHSYAVVLQEPDNLHFTQMPSLDEQHEPMNVIVNGTIVLFGDSIRSLLRKHLQDPQAMQEEIAFAELVNIAKTTNRKDVFALIMRVYEIADAFGKIALKRQQEGRLLAIESRRSPQLPESNASSDGDVE